MIVYGLRSCDTCRKVLRAIEAAGRNPAFVDVRADGLDAETRAAFLERFGASLVNRNSMTWRGLGEEERSLDPDTLLSRYPTLIKRPVIDDGGTLHLGWGPEVQRTVLG